MADPLSVVKKLPICTECEHIATSTGSWEHYKCRAPENEIDRSLNLVNGETVVRRKVEFCRDARKEDQYCGEAGVWFKERQFIAFDKTASMLANKPAKEKSGKFTADEL